jgi:hypothetical protein
MRARARRFLIRYIPPLLLIVAIATYGAMLYAAHDASLRANIEERYVQRLAESPDERSNVISNAREGALLLEPLPSGNAHAQWRLRSLKNTLAPGSVVQSEDAFVTGLDVSLFEPNSEAKISLDGKRIGLFRPLFLTPDDEGPYAVAHAPLGGIDIPPGYTTGFRFPLPAPSACVASDCTLRIDVKNTTWVVRRVGLLFTVRPPTAPGLWQRPFASWIVISIALALAIMSHVVLSVRLEHASPPRARRTAG